MVTLRACTGIRVTSRTDAEAPRGRRTAALRGLVATEAGHCLVMTDPSTAAAGDDRRTTTPEGRDADAPPDEGTSPDLPEFGHDGPEHYPTEKDPS